MYYVMFFQNISNVVEEFIDSTENRRIEDWKIRDN